MELFPLEIQDNIRHTCRVKSYPDGSRDVMIADRAIFREPGWELSDKWDSKSKLAQTFWESVEAQAMEDAECSVWHLERREAAEAAKAADNLDRAKRRARVAISDLALSNEFRYFVTLTLDGAKVDRYDVREITRKLNNWLDNHVRRDGLAYVLVPERHKDGAVHFHGFFNDALPVVDSGTIDLGTGKPRKPRSKAQREAWLAGGGHVVYNLPAWTLGFTTAIELYGTRRAAVGYVCKYVTKAQEKIGGRWYYSGGDLRRPAVDLCDAAVSDFSDVKDVREFNIDTLGVRVLKFTLEGGKTCGEC